MSETIEDRIGALLERTDERFRDEPDATPAEEIEEEEIEQEEEEGEEPTKAEESDEEEVAVSTIGELAEHLGVEVADLYGIKIPVTAADGSKKEVSIGEWKDSFRETAIVKAERQRYEQEFMQAQEQLAQKAQSIDAAMVQADAMIKAAETQILGELSALGQLEHTDPAQYAMKSAKLRDKRDDLARLRNEAIQNYQTHQQQMRQEQEAQRQQFLQKQAALLTDYIPEWRDESVQTRERQEVVDYLLKSGIPEQEVNNIDSAKVVELARKAMLWDRQKDSKPEAKKKVVSIGKKILKAGKAQTKQAKQTASREKDYQSFKKSGDVNAAAKYIEQHLLGDF